jgi:hypothetical protein
MREEKAYKIVVGRPKENSLRSRRRSEDNIKTEFKKQGGGYMSGSDSSGAGKGSMAGCCQHNNKPSGSIQGGEFLDQQQRLLASQRNLCSMELYIRKQVKWFKM